MDRIEIAEGLSFSRIVYGMWRLGDDADTSPGHVQAKVEACLEQGITTLDQADIYGGYTAEGILGDCFRAAPGLAERCEIVTKCGIVGPFGRYVDAGVKHYDTSPEHIRRSVDLSLSEMGVERIDCLLIHRPDPMIDPEATGRTLDDLVSSGKVRAVGVSNFRPWDLSLLQSAMEETLVVNQVELSLLSHEALTNGDLAFLMEHGVHPMAWSPLGGGALMTGRDETHGALRTALADEARRQGTDMAAVAVAWLLAHPARILPVVGTNSMERIPQIGRATGVEMDRATWYRLYTAALGREVA